MDRTSLARYLDATLLRPGVSDAEIVDLCLTAAEFGAFAVCVPPTHVLLAKTVLGSGDLAPKVATVVGFPTGAHQGSVKALEAARAALDGADEIDMVINLSAAKAGDWKTVEDEVHAVRQSLNSRLLKVIIESAFLTGDEIVAACCAARDGGADFVKTSTGFHPAGGASVEAVALMASTVPALGVKASGGIKTPDQAEAMIAAGATRLGVSSVLGVLGLTDQTNSSY